jgi:MoaA/NifB/PqqE/SkfB family radical SAM enzyme
MRHRLAGQSVSADGLPCEFDLLHHGYTMAGWDFTRMEVAAAISNHCMLNPAIELGTNACPWNCDFCFTEDPANPDGAKRRLKEEMSIAERLNLIRQAAALGARSINFVGAGEPTIDPNFWEILGCMRECGITPIVYTEATLHLTDASFVQRLYDIGATVVVKVNSLWNAAYQNAIVAGPSARKRPNADQYFTVRQQAIELLFKAGFADATPTRLAFDTIVCRENAEEIPRLHRWARTHNVFVLVVNYLPSGRSGEEVFYNALSREEQFALFTRLAEIDRDEFGIEHASRFPYAGGTPCTIRGLGLYVKIKGDVFDCPGEGVALGSVRETSLADLWAKVKPITQTFDGGCAPREMFWAQHAAKGTARRLPVVR